MTFEFLRIFDLYLNNFLNKNKITAIRNIYKDAPHISNANLSFYITCVYNTMMQIADIQQYIL